MFSFALVVADAGCQVAPESGSKLLGGDELREQGVKGR